jgi:hypothetical protein
MKPSSAVLGNFRFRTNDKLSIYLEKRPRTIIQEQMSCLKVHTEASILVYR